jgi:LacI family transcriptional regulator
MPMPQLTRLALFMARGGSAVDVDALVNQELEAQGLDSSLLPAANSKASAGPVMIVAWNLERPGLFGQVAHLCQDTLRHMGYQCLLVDCGADHGVKRAYIKQAVALRCAGVVLAGVPGDVPNPNEELIAAIEPAVAHGIPTVLAMPWNESLPLPRGVAGVGWDDGAARSIAIDHLVGAGHRDIGVLIGETGPFHHHGRYQGIDDVMKSRGIAFKENLVAWPTSDAADVSDVIGILKQATAVFAPPSVLSILGRAFYEAGYHWPDDVSVITVGHERFMPRLGPRPFTYVGIPLGKASRGAAHLLATLMQDDASSFSQEFVVFGSSAMLIANGEGGSVAPVATTTSQVSARQLMGSLISRRRFQVLLESFDE